MVYAIVTLAWAKGWLFLVVLLLTLNVLTELALAIRELLGESAKETALLAGALFSLLSGLGLHAGFGSDDIA